jgi:hypothetical protein
MKKSSIKIENSAPPILCITLSFMNPDGQSTQDTQRIQEGSQGEAEGGRNLFSEACAPSGEASGNQKPQRQIQLEASFQMSPRIIKLENSLQVKEPIHMHANTTQEIEKYLYSVFPIEPHAIGMRFSTSRDGTPNRKFIEGAIDPSEVSIYIKLYLKKH